MVAITRRPSWKNWEHSIKDQVFEQPHADPVPDTAPSSGPERQTGRAVEKEKQELLPTRLLRWFFLLVALGLATSSGLGVYLGVTQSRGRALAWSLLATGCVLPLARLTLS